MIRDVVNNGVPYIGTSAGANIAGLTIKTTNDMPIVHPKTLDALALVPFNINPHYIDKDPSSTHRGESRETRIREFLEFNDVKVLALREGAMLRVNDDHAYLKGNSARVFIEGKYPSEHQPGDSLDFLLS